MGNVELAVSFLSVIFLFLFFSFLMLHVLEPSSSAKGEKGGDLNMSEAQK